MFRSLAVDAANLSAMVSPFRSDASKLILYHPLAISVTALAHAANAAPSIDLVAVTVKPVPGVISSDASTIRNGKFASAVFFVI